MERKRETDRRGQGLTEYIIIVALVDRMETIRLAGYTLNEKMAIAQRYLVRKQIEANGLKGVDVVFEDDALRELIERYTREAGVRSLEREIASVCRKLARKVVGGEIESRVVLSPARVIELLGVPRYHPLREIERQPEVGVATGLAWTEVGGEMLMTEATLMRGRGKLTLTGQLGDVMQESAQAALSYIRSRADALGIDHLWCGATAQSAPPGRCFGQKMITWSGIWTRLSVAAARRPESRRLLGARGRVRPERARRDAGEFVCAGIGPVPRDVAGLSWTEASGAQLHGPSS